MNNFVKNIITSTAYTVAYGAAFMFLSVPAHNVVQSLITTHTVSITDLRPSVLGKDHANTAGNFNPAAGLDTTQVEWGEKVDRANLTMFCFISEHNTTAWDCFQFEDIPAEEWYAEGTDHLVWAGPVKEIQSAYEKLS